MASTSRRPDPGADDGERPGGTLADLTRRYSTIRKGLIAFFRRRQASDPETLADEVLFRVLRQLLGAVPIHDTLEQYCTGVAKLVLHESWRRRKTDALSESLPSHEKDALDRLDGVERQALLRFSMESIPEEEAAVWTRYHNEDRVALAAELGITPNALRIRVHRAQKAMIVIGRQVLGSTGLK